MAMEANNTDDDSIHGEAYMSQFIYKFIHYIEADVDDHILQKLGHNWHGKNYSYPPPRYKDKDLFNKGTTNQLKDDISLLLNYTKLPHQNVLIAICTGRKPQAKYTKYQNP